MGWIGEGNAAHPLSFDLPTEADIRRVRETPIEPLDVNGGWRPTPVYSFEFQIGSQRGKRERFETKKVYLTGSEVKEIAGIPSWQSGQLSVKEGESTRFTPLNDGDVVRFDVYAGTEWAESTWFWFEDRSPQQKLREDIRDLMGNTMDPFLPDELLPPDE